jgi:hypothetical protein
MVTNNKWGTPVGFSQEALKQAETLMNKQDARRLLDDAIPNFPKGTYNFPLVYVWMDDDWSLQLTRDQKLVFGTWRSAALAPIGEISDILDNRIARTNSPSSGTILKFMSEAGCTEDQMRTVVWKLCRENA